MDVWLHFGRDSQYELPDPQREPRGYRDGGSKITKMHDGSNGFMQLKQLLELRNQECWQEAVRDFLRQLPFGSRQARRRAERFMRKGCPELHVGSTCNQGRHRAVMASNWLAKFFSAFADVGRVVVIHHHLRPWKKDGRGECGCSRDACATFGNEPAAWARTADRASEIMRVRALIRAFDLAKETVPAAGGRLRSDN